MQQTATPAISNSLREHAVREWFAAIWHPCSSQTAVQSIKEPCLQSSSVDTNELTSVTMHSTAQRNELNSSCSWHRLNDIQVILTDSVTIPVSISRLLRHFPPCTNALSCTPYPHTHTHPHRVAASFVSQLLVTNEEGRTNFNVPPFLLTYLSTSVFTIFLPLVQIKSLLQETWLLRSLHWSSTAQHSAAQAAAQQEH